MYERDEWDELYGQIEVRYEEGWNDAEGKFLPILRREMQQNVSLKAINDRLEKSEQEMRRKYAEDLEKAIEKKKAEYQQGIEQREKEREEQERLVTALKSKFAKASQRKLKKGEAVFIVVHSLSSEAPMLFSSEERAKLYAKAQRFKPKIFRGAIL
jgi:site-specific recombinase XerD